MCIVIRWCASITLVQSGTRKRVTLRDPHSIIPYTQGASKALLFIYFLLALNLESLISKVFSTVFSTIFPMPLYVCISTGYHISTSTSSWARSTCLQWYVQSGFIRVGDSPGKMCIMIRWCTSINLVQSGTRKRVTLRDPHSIIPYTQGASKTHLLMYFLSVLNLESSISMVFPMPPILIPVSRVD